jgi:hypothetical protein
MLQPLELVVSQISKTDQQLQYYLILEQQETNRLLRQMIEQKQVIPDKIDDIGVLKRPDLMKRIGKTKAPQGWQKWSNDKMVDYLKGELM